MSRDGGRRADVDDVRDQLADDLGVDRDQIGVQERRDTIETRLRDGGRQQLREDLSADDEFVQPDDIDIDDTGTAIDAGISDLGRRRATTRRLEDSLGVDIDPDEVILDDDGPQLEETAQERVDSARIEDLQSDLPSDDDIFFPTDSTEARNVSAALGRQFESGDIGQQTDVTAAAGRRSDEIDTGLIEDLDPEFAEELDQIDPEDIEQAQEDIQERRQLLDEDPSAFFEPIEDDVDGFFEDATRLDRRADAGRGQRRAARQQIQELERDIAGDSEQLDPDDLDIRADFTGGGFDVDLSDEGRQRLQADVAEDIQADADVDIDIPRSAVEVRRSDDGFEFELEEDFQRDIAREQAAQEADVDPSDVVVEEDGDELTARLSDDFLEERRRDEEEEIQAGLIEDLDEDFPGVDITEDDVEIEIEDDTITAELTDGALRDIERQSSLISDFEVDISDLGTGSGAAGSAFVGSATAQTGVEDPLRDAQPQGLAVGDTQLIGPGEDLPTSLDELGDVDFGSDELLTTDLPTSVGEAAPIVRETSRDIARAPAERAVGGTIQRSMDARDLVSGDFDELVDSSVGQTAVAAGAAGIAAPEPATTIGGAAVAGGAILGSAALDVSRRGEIDIDPRDVQQDRSELEVGEPRATTSELDVGRPRREAGEVSRPTSPEPVSAEIETPQTGEVVDGSEIGVPRIEAQQATGMQREGRLVEDLDELLDEEEAERLRREELSETARQQQEQQIFEQRREFGEIERETIPERDRFEPIEIDDIGEGIAGRGEPETFGERDETFAERFDRIIEERQQEEQQRFFEQQESVVTRRPGDQQTGDVGTLADQTAATGFVAPAASQGSLNLPIGSVDDIADTGVDSDVDDAADFGTEPRTTETTATGQQPAFDTAQPTAFDATTEPALAAETALNQAVETVDATVQQPAFAEPTVTQTAAQPGQQGQQAPRIPRPELPETDGEFGDDELEWFDVIDERVVRDLDDPDFIAGVDDIDAALDIPDPSEGL